MLRGAWLLLVFFLIGPGPVRAAVLELSSPFVATGEAAVVEFVGTTPSVALGRFRGELFYLTPHPGGASALIGADVDAKPGDYPLQVAVVDRQGRTEFHRLDVRVELLRRPRERLTLPKRMVTPADPQVLQRIARERKMLRAIFAAGGGDFEPSTLILPVDDPVSSVFGLKRILNGIPKSPHSGVDFRSPKSTPVRAALAGRVACVEDFYYTGRTVILEHGAGLYSYYAHLDKAGVGQGERVAPGDVVGAVGSTGRSTGPHLHWGVKLRGDRIDPLALRDLLNGKGLDASSMQVR